MISNIVKDKIRNIWSCGSLFPEKPVNIKCGGDKATNSSDLVFADMYTYER